MQSEFEKKFNATPSWKTIKKFIKNRHFTWPMVMRKLRRRFPRVGLKPGSRLIGHIEIGEYTYFLGIAKLNTYGKAIIGEPGIKIGKFNSIANGFYCSTGVDFHFTHLPAMYPVMKFMPGVSSTVKDPYIVNRIEIGNDVWIGRNCSVLGNVSIGNGAIIGSNSVVTKDVPAYHMAAGNPMSVKKMRFPERTIEQLQEISWWDWPLDKIKRNREFFQQDIQADQTIDLWDCIVD